LNIGVISQRDEIFSLNERNELAVPELHRERFRVTAIKQKRDAGERLNPEQTHQHRAIGTLFRPTIVKDRVHRKRRAGLRLSIAHRTLPVDRSAR